VITVYSIGFTQKTAEQFFGLLQGAGIRRLLDVRLHNISQLAGFAKRDDLRYFVREICGAEYVHEPLLTPTEAILDAYRKRKGSWEKYAASFRDLMRERDISHQLKRKSFDTPTVLLCSEPAPDKCHRRLILEYLKECWRGMRIVHL
jgi:uncharacterized protein (DUF488 family)